MEPLPLPGGVLVIAKPPGGNDTRRVFALYDAYEGPLLRPDVEGMVRALHQRDVAGVGLTMGNVFEFICALEPVFALVHAMQVQGALGAAMTGTGTAVAGLFADEAAAQNCLQSLQQSQLPLEYLGIHRPVPGGPKQWSNCHRTFYPKALDTTCAEGFFIIWCLAIERSRGLRFLPGPRG